MIINSKEEYEILKEGGKNLRRLLLELKDLVKEGKTSLDIENYTREYLKKTGDKPATLGYKPKGSVRPYPAATCVSVNDVIVHGVPNENVVTFKKGDIVSIDIVIEHKGLFVDAATTYWVGEISEEEKRLIEATKLARDKAISIVKAGIRVGEIGKVLSSVAKEYGFSLPPELGGHGVGRKIHERPFIGNYDGAPDSDYILKEGEVITIEPMMSMGSAKLELMDDQYSYRVKDGSQTAHFEHTLVVWQDGAEVLT